MEMNNCTYSIGITSNEVDQRLSDWHSAVYLIDGEVIHSISNVTDFISHYIVRTLKMIKTNEKYIIKEQSFQKQK